MLERLCVRECVSKREREREEIIREKEIKNEKKIIMINIFGLC